MGVVNVVEGIVRSKGNVGSNDIGTREEMRGKGIDESSQCNTIDDPVRSNDGTLAALETTKFSRKDTNEHVL